MTCCLHSCLPRTDTNRLVSGHDRTLDPCPGHGHALAPYLSDRDVGHPDPLKQSGSEIESATCPSTSNDASGFSIGLLDDDQERDYSRDPSSCRVPGRSDFDFALSRGSPSPLPYHPSPVAVAAVHTVAVGDAVVRHIPETESAGFLPNY